MAKKIKIQIPAGQASAVPPVGPMLGQAGINIMEFCKEFNDMTKNEEPGTPIPAEILVNPNKSFTFTIKKPPVSYLLKKAAKVSKGSGMTGRKFVGSITEAQCREIAQIKMEDQDIDTAVNTIKGTARSMGIRIKG